MRNAIYLFFLFCFQTAFAQEPPAKYSDVWMKFNEDPTSESLQKELKQLRKQNPNDPWIFWISGLSVDNPFESEEAIVFYKQAIAADSTFPHAYYNLAVLSDDTTEAGIRETIDLYTKAVTYDKTLGFSWLARSEAYLSLGDYDQALADCESARKCSDYDPQVAERLNLEILWKQGKKEEAFAFVRKTEFTDTMWPLFDEMLGNIYEEMGDHESACTWYRNAAEVYEFVEADPRASIVEKLNGCK